LDQHSADAFKAVGLLFSAMAHHQLGSISDARMVLEQALKLIEQLTGHNEAGLPDYLRREAEALVNGKAE
jgi:hypothetical protein